MTDEQFEKLLTQLRLNMAASLTAAHFARLVLTEPQVCDIEHKKRAFDDVIHLWKDYSSGFEEVRQILQQQKQDPPDNALEEDR